MRSGNCLELAGHWKEIEGIMKPQMDHPITAIGVQLCYHVDRGIIVCSRGPSRLVVSRRGKTGNWAKLVASSLPVQFFEFATNKSVAMLLWQWRGHR